VPVAARYFIRTYSISGMPAAACRFFRLVVERSKACGTRFASSTSRRPVTFGFSTTIRRRAFYAPVRSNRTGTVVDDDLPRTWDLANRLYGRYETGIRRTKLFHGTTAIYSEDIRTHVGRPKSVIHVPLRER